MMYIIMNCPALDYDDITCRDSSCDECGMVACIERTNCLLKQIVNECKMNMSDDGFKYVLKHKNDEGIIWLTDSSEAILNILRLLEIEEVEE